MDHGPFSCLPFLSLFICVFPIVSRGVVARKDRNSKLLRVRHSARIVVQMIVRSKVGPSRYSRGML